MRIGIDARFITRQPRRGIGNYSLNLVSQLVNQDPTIEYILYIANPDIEGILPNLPNVRTRQLWPSVYPFWENISLPLAAIKDEIDILHCLGNTAPLVLPGSVRLVLSIMDVMFLQTGEFIPKPRTFYQKWGRLYRAISVPFVATCAKKIITISDFSRQDILQLIDGVHSKKIIVTHLSCDPVFQNESDINENKKSVLDDILFSPFIFCLGAEDPRKNTLRLVFAYLDLLKKNSISHNLVISGYANWENSESFRIVREAGAESRVKFLRFIAIDDLALLYRSATVFVYPSLYEGFGIPLLEAFSSGCPVIASNVTSIPEVGSDAALYFDPLNVDEMAETLLQVINDSVLRQQLVARGFVRAKQFTWKETARKTLAVYRECMDVSQA